MDPYESYWEPDVVPALEERVTTLEDRVETLWNQFLDGLS